MSIDCTIRNGKLVIPKQGIFTADLAIKGEKIVQIGSCIPSGEKNIDASGKYIFPGCVDTHTHYGHYNEFYDEMETESKCLAFLGVTTSVILLDRCIKNMEGWKEKRDNPEYFKILPGIAHPIWRASYKKVLPEAIRKSEEVSTNDFAFHLLMENIDQINEMPEYYREFGIASYKFWLRERGLSPAEIWVLFKHCKELGVLPYVNTINQSLLEHFTREMKERCKVDGRLPDPALIKESRPAIIETLDLHSVLYLAKDIGLPRFLICHVCSRDSVQIIRYFRKEYGLNVEGESCVAWLSFWWPDIGEKLGYMATCIGPQFGYREDVISLWGGIGTGDITCVGTDSVISARERYSDGKPNPAYEPPPNENLKGLGFPTHVCFFPVVLHLGMERGFSPVQIAEVCSYNPANLMQLYPKKGTIAIGADADLVIMDIGKSHRVRKGEIKTAASFNPWDGWELNCWPTVTMIRGQVIFENGILINEKKGKYQPRYPK